MSKKLQDLLDRRELMIAAGASPENLAVIDRRIAEATPKAKVHVPQHAAVATDADKKIAALEAEVAALRAELAGLVADEAVEVSGETFTVTPQAEVWPENPFITYLAEAAPAGVEAENPFIAYIEKLESGEVEAAPVALAPAKRVTIENPFAKFLEEKAAKEAAAAAVDPSFAEVFAAYEPVHVAAVRDGAEARFVVAPGIRWAVAARDDQVAESGEVTVRLKSGETTVPIVGDVLARSGSVAVYAVAVSGNRAVA